MKKLALSLLALSSLILSNPPGAEAQYWLYAQFHLTATVQEPISQEFPRRFREKTVKIDNAKLLEILGAATTNDFTGADLVVDHSGLGFSVLKGTNVLADVSSLLSRSGMSALFVLQGKQSSDTAFDVTRKAVLQYTFMPANAEHSFTFWAHERSRMVWTGDGTNSPTAYFERAQSDGVGEGVWNERAAVLTGTIDLSSQSPGVVRSP